MTKIVYMAADSQTPTWLAARWREHTEFEFYNADTVYHPHTVFMYDVYRSDLSSVRRHLAQGHRVIVDNANEHFVHETNSDLLSLSQQVGQQICWIISGVEPARTHFRIVATPYWYWIIDQENFRHGGLDRMHYNPTGEYQWLCTMSLTRPERDHLYTALSSINRPHLMSYRDRGRFIEGDDQTPAWQRRINPDWLKKTYYTIVPESYVQDYNYRTGIAIAERNDEFICEKTLKPLAAQHPFMLVSTRGNLQHVRDLGFETFPELFDESYDHHFSWQRRIDAVIEQARQFNPAAVNQPRVRDKLRHNQDRFFDRNLVSGFFADTVAAPVLKWIYETT